MLKEEWRIHARLFGGWGFATFPLVIFTASALTFGLMYVSGFEFGEIHVGLHYAVAFLGLNVGSIGFVSRDAVENLLGESNLLIFSSRTLPVSVRRVLAAFVVKDVIYYSFLYLTPLTLALVPAAVYFGTGVSVVPLLWLTLSGTFALGVSVSFLGATLYTRGRVYVVAATVALAAAVVYFGWSLVVLTPLNFFENPTFVNLLLGFSVPLPLSLAGIYAFDFSGSERSRSYTDRFASLDSLLSRVSGDGLVTKMLLDLTRSSGGVWKVFFSVGILFGVFVFMVEYIPLVSQIVSSPGIAFATLLALSTVSVYNWLNMFDRASNYLMLPVDVTDVIAAKFVAYLVVSLPVSYLYLLAGGVLFGFDEIAVGAVALPLVSLYVFGVTVYLTGLSPDELLLNSKLFAVFTVLVALVAIPLFVGSFVYVRYPTEVTAVALGLSAVSGAVGYVLYRRAKTRWSDTDRLG